MDFTKKYNIFRLLVCLFCSFPLTAGVDLGLDRIFSEPYSFELTGKNIGLVTNQSAINAKQESAFDLFFSNQEEFGYKLFAAFAPEHGLDAKLHAFDKVEDSQKNQVNIFSLHGDTKRPTDAMLSNIDLVIFDMQTVGVRCYTYETTLCYVIEKAAELKIPVIVLDRPNPRGGLVVEGGTLEEKYKSFFSYNEIPFCHGMTIGELARYFNAEQKVNCDLKVVPMTGWKRSMSFQDTQLSWAAPSPNIPDGETALVYPATIFLGETLEIVSVDLRGNKPFKRIGAPWLEGHEFASILNQRNLPGVLFSSEIFTPKWGKYESATCGGVLIKVTSIELFQPLLTQYVIFEELMRTYPQHFERELAAAMKKGRRKACNYLTGNEKLMSYLERSQSFVDEIKILEDHYIKDFLSKREKYLIY
ncbi:MAG: hypothetical protein S4CHLAM6_03780 [Chlamydiae bacterium]|nr:hypothetical protein [Chlamydiota bacterium]